MKNLQYVLLFGIIGCLLNSNIHTEDLQARSYQDINADLQKEVNILTKLIIAAEESGLRQPFKNRMDILHEVMRQWPHEPRPVPSRKPKTPNELKQELKELSIDREDLKDTLIKLSKYDPSERIIRGGFQQ